MDTITVNGRTLAAIGTGADPLIPDTGMTLMAVAVGRALSEAEANRLAALTGYAWRAKMNGTPLVHAWHPATPTRIVFAKHYDDIARTDPVHAWATFTDLLTTYVAEGTPVRTTDRAGAGTKGTRLIDGFGDTAAAALRVYADRVAPISTAAFLQALSGTVTRL